MAESDVKDGIFILVDSPLNTAEGLSKFAGPQTISADKLREHLQNFVGKISEVIGGVSSLAANYELSEVEVEASFNAETGFVFVAKTGIEGAVKLTFRRKEPSR